MYDAFQNIITKQLWYLHGVSPCVSGHWLCILTALKAIRDIAYSYLCIWVCHIIFTCYHIACVCTYEGRLCMGFGYSIGPIPLEQNWQGRVLFVTSRGQVHSSHNCLHKSQINSWAKPHKATSWITMLNQICWSTCPMIEDYLSNCVDHWLGSWSLTQATWLIFTQIGQVVVTCFILFE